jgi:hypothetical protein
MAKVPESHVRIRNNHTAPITLPPLLRHNKVTEQFEALHEQKTLAPGEGHNVDAEHWAEVSAKSPVREWVKVGLISESDESVSKPEGKAEPKLADMADHDAVKFVENMTDRGQLELAQADHRGAVSSAATRRIEKLGVKK